MSDADDGGDTTSSSPFVSVVIPAYNDAGGVQLTLESVTNQTYPTDRYEVVVADNGSANVMDVKDVAVLGDKTVSVELATVDENAWRFEGPPATFLAVANTSRT